MEPTQKVTYAHIGYEPNIPAGKARYDFFREAYNVLGENQDTAIPAFTFHFLRQ